MDRSERKVHHGLVKQESKLNESTVFDEELPVIVRRRGCMLRVRITSFTDTDTDGDGDTLEVPHSVQVCICGCLFVVKKSKTNRYESLNLDDLFVHSHAYTNIKFNHGVLKKKKL